MVPRPMLSPICLLPLVWQQTLLFLVEQWLSPSPLPSPLMTLVSSSRLASAAPTPTAHLWMALLLLALRQAHLLLPMLPVLPLFPLPSTLLSPAQGRDPLPLSLILGSIIPAGTLVRFLRPLPLWATANLAAAPAAIPPL